MRGMILVDIILAFSIATVFIAVIAESSMSGRRVFEVARERSRLLDVYAEHMNNFDDLGPYQSRRIVVADALGATTSMQASARWYGDERLQEDIVVGDSISFTRIRPYTPISSFLPKEPASSPLCSVDFSGNYIVGSRAPSRSDLSADNTYDSHPLTASITPITLPINPSLPLTDLEVRDGIAYVSTDSSTASDPDLLVIDIDNPSAAKLLSSINTGPGIASIALSGNRIFAAAASSAAQLHSIYINSLSSLSLEKKYKLPLPYATATPPLGSSIFYDENRVYLGTEKWDGDEFSIVDVTNPAAPAKIGGFETGSKVNDILVRGTFVYVADSDQQQLRVLDISQPPKPTLVNSFSPSGFERQEGKALSLFEDGLTFGRTSGGFNITQDHEIFAWATTSSTTLAIPSAPIGRFSADIPGGVYGIVGDRGDLYLATRQLDHELEIVGRLYDGTLATSSAVSYALPVAPQTITCDRDKLYLIAHSAPVIYEITFN